MGVIREGCIECVKRDWYKLWLCYFRGGSLTDFLHVKILMLCVVYLYSYRPTLSVDYIANILGFSSSSECVNFLAGCDAVMNDSQTAIDCKLTHDKMSK